MSNGKETGLVTAFAIGIPALIAFHEYSTYLSSPWTTQKLADPEDAPSLWRLYWEATAATILWTLATGLALAYGMGNYLPVLIALASAGAVAVWIWYDYDRALKGEL